MADNKDSFPEAVTDTEKLVKDVITKRIAERNDFHTIAKVCKISEVEAAVAVQLLEYKKMIPRNDASLN